MTLLESHQLLILPFVRLAAILSCLPFVGYSLWEWRFRLVLAGLLCIVLMPVFMPIQLTGSFMLALSWELILGILIGFSLYCLTQALVFIGRLMGSLSGFSFAKLIAPVHGMPETLMMQMMSVIGATLFFYWDLHHIVIMGLSRLFVTFPVGMSFDIAQLIGRLVHHLKTSFGFLPMVAVPFAALMTTVLISLSLINRNKMEMNIFNLGLPILILLTFIVFAIQIDELLLVSQNAMLSYLRGLFA